MIVMETMSGLGEALRQWRGLRRVSQMDLALEAGISPRHLSFIETGRTQPSREVVLQLAGALRLPYRHQNSLLLAAGYAPQFSASRLGEGQMAVVRQAVARHLQQHEPYPAVAVNQAYDILQANEGFRRTMGGLVGPAVLDKYPNVLRLTFAADGLRPFITCWPLLRDAMLLRLREEALMAQDPAIWALLEELQTLATEDEEAPPDRYAGLPVMYLELEKDGRSLRFFSTITTFGTPLDATVQELRLESFFPADAETQAAYDAAASLWFA